MFSSLVQLAISFAGMITKKPKISDVFGWIFTYIPQTVGKLIEGGQADTKSKFDDFLEAFDAGTGVDPGAINFEHDIPPEMQEAFFDHLKEAARIIGYHKLKVPGYFQ